MAKWKAGDVVRHKGTGENLLILHVRAEEALSNNKIPVIYVAGENLLILHVRAPVIYVVRLPNYQRADIEEFELEAVQVGHTIKD